MNSDVVGIDIAKNVFHMVALNHRGRVLERKKVYRESFIRSVSSFAPGSVICMEACQGAHEWCRQIEAAGYQARQIAAQHVKPYRKSQKNDYNDAEAIAEAGSRESTWYVPTKTEQQQELQALQNLRLRHSRNRTALMNQARAFLAEHGIAIREGERALLEKLRSDLAGIPAITQALCREMLDELTQLNARLKKVDVTIRQQAKESDVIRRLMTIPGVGVLTALALSTVSGNPHNFKNGRQFAAFLGLVPKQDSTGDKPRLGRITKAGNAEVRRLLVIGAHSTAQQAVRQKKTDPRNLWIRKLHAEKGANLTAVAVANKNARIAWHILTTPGEVYDPSPPRADLPHPVSQQSA